MKITLCASLDFINKVKKIADQREGKDLELFPFLELNNLKAVDNGKAILKDLFSA